LVGIDSVQRGNGNADCGADVDAMTIDFKGILQRSGNSLRKPLGVRVALGVDKLRELDLKVMRRLVAAQDRLQGAPLAAE
jgi:hypothetical protein